MSKESIDARRVPLGRETKGMQKQISAKFGKSQQQKQSALAARRWALVQKMKGTSAAIALFAALAFATPAMAQWNYDTTPLGSGYSTTEAHGPHGQRATGETVPLGSGYSTTTCR